MRSEKSKLMETQSYRLLQSEHYYNTIIIELTGIFRGISPDTAVLVFILFRIYSEIE
jgi:hypothetical protein